MCKQKKRKVSAPSKSLWPEQKIFSITAWISLIFWFFLAASVICKVIFQKGICSCIAGSLGYVLIPSAIVNTESILEVAKTIGLGSLFVAWIYAELGKSELGKPYVDLLKDFCSRYYLRTFSHIAAVLACIWLSITGTIESSFLALVIVMVGLVDQAIVLTRFIFYSKRRKEIAITRWKHTFNISNNPQNDSTISPSDLYTLEDAISVKDSCCEALCNCLAQAILNYIQCSSAAGSKKESIIIAISNFWENLFEGRSENEQSLLLFKMISQFESCCDQSQERILVSSGYLMWLCRHYAREGKDSDESDSNVMLKILSDITQINHRADPSSQIPKCLDTLYVLLAWMHFLCNDIILCQQLLESFMLHASAPQPYSTEDKECFHAFAVCMFHGDICEKYFDIAWKRTVEQPQG